MTKISGVDLKAGHIIKHSGRIYLVKELGPPDGINNSRYGTFETTGGAEVNFYVFGDSQYELRSRPGRPRNRMVRVRASDIEILFQSPADPVELEAAVARLKAAVQ